MLLQTNSYIVPKDKRTQHQRLVQRFRQTLARLGCDHFEAYEQVGANWRADDTTGRFVQLMRFHDRKHQLAVQGAERNDPTAQGLIKEFCELINFPYQQQQGLFAVGFYHSLLPVITPRAAGAGEERSEAPVEENDDQLQEIPPAAAASLVAPRAESLMPLSEDSSDEMPLSPSAQHSEPETDDPTDADALLDEMESLDEEGADPAGFNGNDPGVAVEHDVPRGQHENKPS